ncbi:Invasion protein B, involved in pathogenesis [Ruegeria denitrificans]|uniref:Invasion protein B, involved in pathogenesis n=1 Tax=Ruegeria denitrificans TaxID=1715692 RepID=A0A0P1IEU1_9RHOB|nr:invasion associated locus B family protein [Ruegeria denitrificans]CUJ95147.1 Invasion protein B, involved in pathogenesis [Ruegeria denitrificans]
MIKNTLSLSLTVAALCCGAAFAQEAAQDAETPQTQVTPDLDLGEAGPRVGEQYVKEESGDWAIMCIKTETENDPCAMRQILTGDQGQPIAEITIEKLPEAAQAAAGATIVVPLEVVLQAQIALSIDGAPGKRYNYHHCNPIGCLAQVGFTQQDVDAMKSGTKGTLSMVSILAPTQALQLEISLAGFTAGFDQLQVIQN